MISSGRLLYQYCCVGSDSESNANHHPDPYLRLLTHQPYVSVTTRSSFVKVKIMRAKVNYYSNLRISLNFEFLPFQDTIAFILLLLCTTKNYSHGLMHPRLFDPIPDTIVDGFCKWEVRLNTVYNRIPPVITEIHCVNPHSSCAGNSNFKVRILFSIQKTFRIFNFFSN